MASVGKNVRDNLYLSQSRHERNFCAAAFADPKSAINEYGWLLPDIFVNESMKKFWKRVLETGDSQAAAIELDVFMEITEAVVDAPTLARMDVSSTQIVRHSYLNQVLSGIGDVVKNLDIDHINEVKQIIVELSELETGVGGKDQTLDEIHVDFVASMYDRSKVVMTGFSGLDRYIGGLFAGELSILASRPAMGKTALLMQIAIQSVFAGKKVLFFSLEMSARQLWARIICPRAGVSWVDVRSGKATEEELLDVEDMSKEMLDKFGDKLIIDDKSSTVFDMQASVIMHRPDVVFIDQLNDINWHVDGVARNIWYGQAMKYIKREVAKRHDVPVLMNAQIGRKVDERNNKRPTLSDLKWSSDIEQRADAVLFMYREDYYEDDDEDNLLTRFERGDSDKTVSLTEIIVAKNRQGPCRDVAFLNYHLESQWFMSPEKGIYENDEELQLF